MYDDDMSEGERYLIEKRNRLQKSMKDASDFIAALLRFGICVFLVKYIGTAEHDGSFWNKTSYGFATILTLFYAAYLAICIWKYAATVLVLKLFRDGINELGRWRHIYYWISGGLLGIFLSKIAIAAVELANGLK